MQGQAQPLDEPTCGAPGGVLATFGLYLAVVLIVIFIALGMTR